jgi:hypothetical protein
MMTSGAATPLGSVSTSAQTRRAKPPPERSTTEGRVSQNRAAPRNAEIASAVKRFLANGSIRDLY